MTQSLILNLDSRPAFVFAREGHESIGQVRKYTGEPYFGHPLRVANIILDHGIEDLQVLDASANHDGPEDVYPLNKKYSLAEIYSRFGSKVAQYVNEVTNTYTKAAFPQYSRKERSLQEAVRLGTISVGARIIKSADIIDNGRDIKINDPKYSESYLSEKKQVLDFMSVGADGNDPLFFDFKEILKTAYRVVNS